MKDVKKALKNGEVLFGTIICSGNPANIEISGYLGYDFVFIDSEHATPSPYGREMEELIRAAYAADITPIVRTISNDVSQVRKALDFGAKGIIAPFINTKEDAQRLVRACFFPPEGDRGACPAIRPTKYGAMSWFDFVKQSNEETFICAILERLQGVRNVAEICSVKGVSAVWCGFFDLAMELGIRPKGDNAISETAGMLTDPTIERYTDDVIRAATEKGVYVANFIADPRSALDLAKRGCRLIASPPDTNMFTAIAKSFLEESRAVLKEARLPGVKT